ncbi:hypothetical protein HNY73_006602 [Argiope bruennichi]|uniref:Uncharacterized protein n=1 Tax=Argiope bruennichi TaxID=94029 RepID=A0A8T0FBC0_ARGBR|nr:hypothetical protein HNY73_006602 [Argiope bruennichi]
MKKQNRRKEIRLFQDQFPHLNRRTEDFIAEHSLEITQAISLKETWANWAQALAAAKDEGQHLQVKGRLKKDGFIAPAAHLVRKIKNLKPNNVKNKEIEIKKVPEGIEEVALDEEVDADPSPAQPKQKRVPPFFVTPRADFRTMLNILKLEAPSLRSVMSNKFLKLTVETEEEHRSLSHLLESQGAEFKTFMLKQDRPIKVVIRGLPSCTPIEDTPQGLTYYRQKILQAISQNLETAFQTTGSHFGTSCTKARQRRKKSWNKSERQQLTRNYRLNEAKVNARLIEDESDRLLDEFSYPVLRLLSRRKKGG